MFNRFIILAAAGLFLPISAQASTITANQVIEYFEPSPQPAGVDGFSSAASAAARAAAYDGIPNGRDGGPEYEAVDLKLGTTTTDTPATDGNSRTYVSLPDRAFIVLGFVGGFIFDGLGDDLFIDETGNAQERAEVFVSSDFGASFTRLDIANGNRTNRFDFGDYAFLPADITVNAVKLVGLDNNGSSPGFDLTFVRGLEGSVATVPLPAGLPLLAGGLFGLALLRRSRRG